MKCPGKSSFKINFTIKINYIINHEQKYFWLVVPPGCSDPPEEPDYAPIRCSHCNYQLKNKPDRSEDVDILMQCSGVDQEWLECGYDCGMCGDNKIHEPHEYSEGFYRKYYRVCKHCGTENMESDY